MSRNKIADMDVIPNAGSIGSLIVGAKDLTTEDRRPNAA